MTNARTDTDLATDIAAWLREELRLGKTRMIDASTRINLDLGVAGDDGADLMKAFGERYGVDVSTFPCGRYFGSEASANPVSVVWSLGRMLVGKSASGLQPLFVRDLVELAKSPNS